MRVDTPPAIDGDLSKTCWTDAPRSPRFVDLVSGERVAYDTRVAVLWDDENLYVGFWIEEPAVAATLTERDSLIYEDNDVEVFITGDDCYYEFEINAFGTIYEVFFVWDEAYDRAGFSDLPEYSRDVPGARPFNGVGFTSHPRGARTGFWEWDYPGLRSAVVIDGVINDPTNRDRGWTVELAFPWDGLRPLANGRAVPPADGDVWRMSFSRFNQYKEGPDDSSGWTLSAHGVWDSHIPELFPFIHFSTGSVSERKE
ncbi:MAG: polyhydroxyalkanoate depolymerase [bacterium]|nr:polyhydroxyalkanoate depolymerase [bacterium]